MEGRRWASRIGAWALAALVPLLLVYVYCNNPYEKTVTVCFFHALTGLSCPSCGMTRALYQLLHGHPGLAFLENPFVYVLPAVGYMVAAELSFAMFGRRLSLPNIPPRLIWLGVGLLIVYTVARNLL